MDIETIIVQAGGKGSRMETLTRNKPKALVPINNLPMIFHLFRKYPNKKFIVIGDYKIDVLEKYLYAFADVNYELVSGNGATGTCAGLSKALSLVPENNSFMLIWCDLVLPSEFELPSDGENYIGISKDFPCRWKYENGVFLEEKSETQGVAGLFVFKNKSEIDEVPKEGEFVRWLSNQKIQFEELPLEKTHEYGLYSEWKKLPTERCRPFNKIEFIDNKVYKTAIDGQGFLLAEREKAWYKKIEKLQVVNIPTVFSYEPFCMEKINGNNVYCYTDLSYDKKSYVLEQIIKCLKSIQSSESVPADKESYYDAYIGKTFKRLEKVFNLVPFAKDRFILINGKKCRNVLYYKHELEEKVMAYYPAEFRLIHGDCTFSNILLKEDMTPVLIDPRGYFGTTEFYGDPAYDWVKLYYSLISNYDQFNLKRFNLCIDEGGVKLDIESNFWEDMEETFFELLKEEVSYDQMRLLLSIVWLSLTTYAWEDYDSICGAFYNGLYYLEDVL